MLIFTRTPLRAYCFPPHQTDFYFTTPSLVMDGTAKVRRTASHAGPALVACIA